MHLDADLRSSLVHLPLTLYGPLLERGVPPQSIVVELARETSESNASSDVNKIYVGWSGMSAAPLTASSGAFSSSSTSSATSVVSVSPALAANFSPPLQPNSQVKITLLRSPPLPTATRVDVVPLTADDWEILSLNADEVENSMLGQVRAARTGMNIAVHVGRQGRSVCRFKVESCHPPTQDYSSDTDETLVRAVRLTTDTEIVIAPKSRASETSEANNSSQAHDIYGTTGISPPKTSWTSASAASLGTPSAAQEYLRRSPFRVFSLEKNSHSSASIMLRREDAKILSLAFSGSTRGEGRCSITKMPCPAAPDVYGTSFGRTPQNKDRLARKYDGDSHDSLEDSSNDQSNQKVQQDAIVPARATTSAYFTQTPSETSWPPRHVWLSEDTRKRLGIHDFDLVRFSSPSPSGASPSRPVSPDLKRGSDSDQQDTDELAGFTSTIEKCEAIIQNTFRSRAWSVMQTSMQHDTGTRFPRTTSGLLMTGASGSGKTSVAQIIASRLSSLLVASITIDCTQHAEERLSVLRGLFDEWLAASVWHGPTLLILDNLDRIMPADQEHVDSPRSAHAAEALMHRIRDVTAQYPVFVLATAQSTVSLNKVCTIHHVFGETIELKAPTKEARRDILAALVSKRTLLTPITLDYTILAGRSEGYLPVDLRDLVERAVHQSAIRGVSAAVQQEENELDGEDHGVASAPNGLSSPSSAFSSKEGVNGHGSFASHTLTMDDFTKAQEGFTPLSLRDIQLTQSATRWSDIGGLQETRRVLRETLEWPTRYARIFAQCPLRLRSGLLLYGYPGCGKTLLAGAVAAQCGLNFISVKGPEILQKYIGASEKSVRDLFDRAQAAKPCVLFFDEFDSIAPKRGHDSTGVTDRVVNQLLTQMDGAEGLSGVYVLAATSRPDLIDSALLRPGRLDKSLLCDLPSEEDRLDILQVLCQSNSIRLAEDVDLRVWAQRTNGFSGADLQALIYNANLEAIHESMDTAGHQKASGDKSSSKQDSQQQVRFVQFGGNTKHPSSSKSQSGAEKQAMQRRMELILKNAALSNSSNKQSVSGSKADSSPAEKKDAELKAPVTEAQLQKCFKTTRQSVPADEQVRLRRIYQEFSGERDGEFPSGEASREVGARQSLM